MKTTVVISFVYYVAWLLSMLLIGLRWPDALDAAFFGGAAGMIILALALPRFTRRVR